jgi:hypothetical protein
MLFTFLWHHGRLESRLVRGIGTMTRLAILLLFGALLLVPKRGWARERLAVVIVSQSDPTLADNLTEVAIAALAERENFELVGTRELLDQSRHWTGRAELHACVSKRTCLHALAGAANAERALLGKAERRDDGLSIELTLVGLSSAEVSSRVVSTAPDVPGLILAVQRGVAELFNVEPKAGPDSAPGAVQTKTHAGAARARVGAPPGAARAAENFGPARKSPSPSPPERAPQRHYVRYGTALLAAASFAAAVVIGAYAEGTPKGATRADAQRDLARRADFAKAANGLGIVGGALSITCAASFIWRFP